MGVAGATLSPQREYAAKYSWFLLDLLTKSLLLSTAGVRERRVSLVPFGGLFGQGAGPDGGPLSSPFGPFSHKHNTSFAASSGGGSSGSGSGSGGGGGAGAGSGTFFKSSVLKLLTELVCALTHEIFFLSSVSLSLSKLLNKNVALFLRDAFYIFPKSVCFDWVSLYLQISHTRETVSSSMRAATSGSSGSSSRFKYIALQIVCDHEHFVAYNNRATAFVGEAKKYLQGSEFGEFNMGDYQNQSKEDVLAAAASAPAANNNNNSNSKRNTSGTKGVRSPSSATGDRDTDLLSPMRMEASAIAAAAAAASASPSSGSGSGSASSSSASGLGSGSSSGSTVHARATSSNIGGSSGSSSSSSSSSVGGGSGSGSATSPRAAAMGPPSGHFLPFVLIKQVWLAFRQPGPVGIAPAQQTLLQELALTQSAYTLRSVLLKHELDSRFQSPKKRAQVAQMYIRLLPCLWLNLAKLREMKSEKGPTAAAMASEASPCSPPLANGAPKSTGSTCSAARKDLVACALYVLKNVPSPDLLRHLQTSDYRLHPHNIESWYSSFVELLSLILETTEYAGPLMRRLESITTAGGVVANLSTILCGRMLQAQSGWQGGPNEPGLSDWGGAEEIGGGMSSRLSSLGGLASLESKYTRSRHTSQLSGHRKSMGTHGGGSLKRRDVQMNSNAHAADRARTRLAHRTLNSKAAATLLDGGDAHFFGITGIDPSLQKWEKLYSHESAAIVLHALTQVALPIAEHRLVEEHHMQDRLVWFLHGFLRLNQSDSMLQHMYALLASLLQQHAALIWPLSTKELDSPRCSRWWFELLRYCSFHDATTRAVAQSFMYDLFLSVFAATGSTTRVQVPLVRSFAKVMDALRNRRSESGASTSRDVVIAQTRAAGWTVLQAEVRARDQTNDAAFIGVLSALGKSCRAIFARAEQDPRRSQLAFVGVVQSIRGNFDLLQRILETSALIHSPKASGSLMDPDTLMEHAMSMHGLYALAPRMQLLYLKHVYDQHMGQANLAEAAQVQFKMWQLIDAQMVALARRGAQSRIDLWSSEHALSCLRKSSELFEASELLEHAIHSERLAAAHWVVRSNPVAVVPHQRRLVALYEKLAVIATLGDTRPFGTYYRVGFYGVPFGALDGREFVYRERDLTKLPEITSRLVSLYTAVLGREVTVFKDSGVIDRSALEMGQCKLQVTAVLPYVTPEEEDGAGELPTFFAGAAAAGSGSPAPAVDALRNFDDPLALHSRQSHFEKHTCVNKFFYDTPFTITVRMGENNTSRRERDWSETQRPAADPFLLCLFLSFLACLLFVSLLLFVLLSFCRARVTVKLLTSTISVVRCSLPLVRVSRLT